MRPYGKSPQERARERAMMQSANPRYIPLPIVKPLDEAAKRVGETVTGIVVGYMIYDWANNVVKGFAGLDLEAAVLACQEAEAADIAANPDG